MKSQMKHTSYSNDLVKEHFENKLKHKEGLFILAFNFIATLQCSLTTTTWYVQWVQFGNTSNAGVNEPLVPWYDVE